MTDASAARSGTGPGTANATGATAAGTDPRAGTATAAGTAPRPAAPTRLSWIYPDRGTALQRRSEDSYVWTPYRRIAAELGLDMTLDQPEDVAIDVQDPTDPKVYLRGERVTPQDTLFVTSLYSLPHQTRDVCNQLFLFTNLEALGFYLPTPPWLSYIGEDKSATVVRLAGSPVPTLPTVRIGAGRDAMTGHYDAALAGLDFPMIVKPAYWGMGLGISVVHTVHDLRGVIGLAAGSDTALVAQPYLPGVSEQRVYVVDGRAHTVLWGEKEGYCLVSTRALGGRSVRGYTELPQELAATVDFVAARVPAPYFTIDFVTHEGRTWLTEIELDGAVAFNGIPEQDEVATRIVSDRFRAYVAGHAAHAAAAAARSAADPVAPGARSAAAMGVAATSGGAR